MAALRVARGFTGRDVVVKFEGCYHGHADFLLVKAGSGAATFGVPDSAGVPAATAANTVTLPFNDAARAARALRGARGRDRRGHRRAGRRQHGRRARRARVPRGDRRGVRESRRGLGLRRGDDRLPGRPRRNAGARRSPPGPHVPRQDRRRRDAARRLWRQARDHGEGRAARARLSGRDAEREPGGRQRRPRHARAPRRRALRAPRGARRTARSGARARDRARAARRRACSASGRWSRSSSRPARCGRGTTRRSCDTKHFARWHGGMLERGVYWPPSQFEAAFFGAAHTEADIDATVQAAHEAMG